jgi:ATP-binding cassette subfamily B protein
LELENVSFAYGEADAVLHQVGFSLPSGRVLGVLGRTGSGKTTISRLIARLYDPTQGRVCLGDVDIQDAPLAELRQRVALVTQDVQLFHATVRDNLTFFDRSISDERLTTELRALGLGDWLAAQPHGLDTLLAPAGGNLSAGQAQLLALARAFLRDPSLVILDEASSRLDPATERWIQTGVDRLLVQRTGIIIAHRLETIQRADEILILEDGRIQEYGERIQLARDPNSRFYQLLRTGMEEVLA